MWCIRCYPNGKTERGNFLVQLQLCGLPKQADKLEVSWSIRCPESNVNVSWTTEFDATKSCWGWGSDHFSFDEFQLCQSFEIVVVIKMEEHDNIEAMRRWEHFDRQYIDWHDPEERAFLEASNGGASDGLIEEKEAQPFQVPILKLPQNVKQRHAGPYQVPFKLVTWRALSSLSTK